ncbi:MAG TPA: hypothetical protein VK386_11010, partial [Acidimicrobiales bacterium]|nr:hypothetical protein [Acidimicrobiales bacterium]
LVGYVAMKPTGPKSRGKDDRTPPKATAAGFLRPPPPTPAAQQLLEADVSGVGYATNVSRLWAQLPAALNGLAELMGRATRASSLSSGQRAVLVAATASALGDSYCSMAWGKKLAAATSPDVAAGVLRGGEAGLDDVGQALAKWARLVTGNPNAISAQDVQALRDVGYDDPQIFAITLFVALRLAFSSVNDALGTLPDQELWASLPESVRSAVSFGRPADTGEE